MTHTLSKYILETLNIAEKKGTEVSREGSHENQASETTTIIKPAQDILSAARLIYRFLGGKFEGENQPNLNLDTIYPDEKIFTSETKTAIIETIQAMLSPNPDDRPNIQTCIQEFSRLAGIDVEKSAKGKEELQDEEIKDPEYETVIEETKVNGGKNISEQKSKNPLLDFARRDYALLN